MNLAHPAALLGLLVLPLIVLFYIWRARHRRQVVSSTWLWSEVQARFSHQPSRRVPMREPLLLLQLLAALVLTLLLAGPTFSRSAHLHRIVVLDASIDMAASDVAPSRFAQATRRAQDLVEGLGGGDSLSLILAGPRARLLGELPGDTDLGAVLRALQPSAGVADLQGAAALARGLAGTAGRGMPRVTFLAGAQTPNLSLPGLPVETVRLGGPLDDRGIGVLSVHCVASGQCQAFARVRNTAAAMRADDLAVWADGRVLGRQVLQVPANGSLDLTFAVPQGVRVLRATLERPDALAADDSAWALAPTPPRMRVLLVSDTPGQTLRALRALPGVQVQVVATTAYQDSIGAGQDSVVADSYMPYDLPATSLLLLNPPASNGLVTVHAANVPLSVSEVDAQDPLVTGLDLYGLSATGDALVAPDWAHVAAAGPRGPVLLYGRVASGQRVAVMPIDTGHSALVQTLAYPLLVARLVHWLAPSTPPAVIVGAPVWLPPAVQGVRDPNGVFQGGPVVSAAVPGVYSVALSTGGAAEGDPLFAATGAGPGDTSGVGIALPTWGAPPAAGTTPWGLWPPVLLAALAALGGEWWFYARRT